MIAAQLRLRHKLHLGGKEQLLMRTDVTRFTFEIVREMIWIELRCGPGAKSNSTVEDNQRMSPKFPSDQVPLDER
jgi:hypothetical protein